MSSKEIKIKRRREIRGKCEKNQKERQRKRVQSL
jgi:hypothetical protein